MENKEEGIIKWLMTAFSYSLNNWVESFYFDKKYNHFFSILITDYLLFNENMAVAQTVDSSYSSESKNILINYIRRIESNDPSIICIFPLNIHERKNALIQFINTSNGKELEGVIKQKHINENIIADDLMLNSIGYQTVMENWQLFINEILFKKAEYFINTNNINIEISSILDIEQEGEFTFTLDE
jgi:hypothetical protein